MEKDTLSDDREDFGICLEHEREQRKLSQDDLEFAKLEKQWDDRDIEQRKEEGRPCLTINKLPSFIKQVTNDGRLNRASINVKPVGDGADKATADIQSDLIRNIETQSQSDVVYDTAFDFAVSCGFGYFRVNVDYAHDDDWDQDIMLERISNPFSVYGDYEGKEATSIDWNRAFITDWYSKKAFEKRWGKDKQASSFEDGSSEFDQDWFKDKRIRVAERWIRDEATAELLKLSSGSLMFAEEFLKNKDFFAAQGITVAGTRETRSYKVKQRLITGTDILEENDWRGKYIPIVPMYGEEVNVNGVRHFISLIRRAKDSQRNFNYWRTCATELVALSPKAPFIGAVGQFATDANKWANANRVAYPYIEYDPVDAEGHPAPPPQRQPFAGVPAGALQEAMNASDDMKAIMGLYDASLGARSNETSGVAITNRQREGDTSTFDFLDNRNRSIEHGGRIILDLIPKYYNAERILRCVQEDGESYAMPVNQPVVPPQALQQIMQPPQPPMMGAPMGPVGMPMGMGQPVGPMGQPPMPMQAPKPQQGPPQYVPVPPNLMQMLPPDQAAKLKAITKVFDLTAGKYDVVVTAGPGFTTRREEAAQQMMEFIRIFPQAAPLIGDLLAKNLDWPGAEQVAERLKAMLPPQAQGQIEPMVQHLQQVLQQQDGMAKQAVAKLQQQIQDLETKLKDKTGELQISQYNAETNRIEALSDATKNGVALTQTAEGGIQAVPLMKDNAPSPDVAAEIPLRARELDLRDQELQLKAHEVLSKVRAQDTQTMAQHVAEVEGPGQQRNQAQAHHEAMMATLHHVAQSLAHKPVKKTARAVKQPDGSYMLESVETPVEAQPEVMQQ